MSARRLAIGANYWLDLLWSSLRDKAEPRWPVLAERLDRLPVFPVPSRPA